jgi:outer membrane protein
MSRFALTLVTGLLFVPPVAAQERLTLADAVQKARTAHPRVRAAAAGEQEAAARLRQAHSGWLPRVDFSEGIQRGDMPVYVFGSLLSQRRFTEANFAIDSLNHPDPLTNHRASLTLQHALFSSDVHTGVRTAGIARELAGVGREAVERNLALAATRAFGQALTAQAALAAARAAVSSAVEDARRTRDRRETGLVTEADVLALDVHLAQMRARAIEAESQHRVALAALNDAMGEPLDREYVLAPVVPTAPAAPSLTDLEAEALKVRPEARQATLQNRLAEAERSGARMSFLPQLGWQAGYEWNGSDFSDRAHGWMLGAEVRLNLFRGFADQARLAEKSGAVTRAAAEREAAESAIRLDVRSAWLRLESARARAAVGAASVAQARESQRIVRDRYENGMAGVGDVLRAAQSLLEAELQHTAAETDVIIEAAALDRAVGR